MSTYTKTTNFTAKDNLTSGDPAKVIKGSEFDTEFNSIETAVNSKADANNGTHTGTTTISTADIDTLQIDSVEVTATSAELNTLDGITSTTAELNKLDGFTGTVDDLNYAKDLRATGVTSAELDKIDGLTADSTELNILDGATVTTAELNTLDGITASTAELNTLDGITSTTAELNVLDGITATTAELNVLDGVTSTTAEINKLGGFTGTVADLNYAKDLRATGVTTTEFDKLDGLTATTTELNYTDGVTSNIQTQLDSMVEKAGDTMTGDLSLGDNVKAKFGASNDLEIYHTGSHSFISDVGTGRLYLQGTDGVRVTNASAVNMISAVSGDGVYSYYNGSLKLATTATGVDVTGTITADGLTVGDANRTETGTLGLDYYNSNYYIASVNTNDSDNTNGLTLESGFNGDILFKGYNGFTSSTKGEGVPRLKILDGGDVHLYENTGTTAKFVWDASAESLGIGTVSPSKELEVANNAATGNPTTIRITDTRDFGSWNDNAELGRLEFYANDPSGNAPYPTAYISTVNGIQNGTLPSGELVFATATYNAVGGAVERMRIDDDGNVGIGTASPSATLELSKASGWHGMKVTSSGESLSLLHSGVDASIENSANGATRFYTNGSERARIDSSGNLLVNTSSTLTYFGDAKLQVKTTTGQWGGAFESSSTSSSQGCIALIATTSTPSLARFHVAGSVVGSITSNGTATSYNITSDERLKENIKDTTHVVNIDDIQVREYDWKSDGSHQRFGFIAQELETVYPEAVHSPEDPEEMKSVDYSKLVPLLVKEIQTLKARIEELEK